MTGADAIRSMMDATGGLFRLLPMMRQESQGVFRAASAGDPVATILQAALLATHRQIEAPQGGAACSCIGCGRPLAGQPRSYAVAISDPPLVDRALAMPVCAECGPNPAAIVAAVQPFLRHLWPQTRELPACAFGEGGRA